MISIKRWLDENADLVEAEFGSKAWITKSRGDYLTLEGMEEKLSYLLQHGITEHLSSTWEAGKPVNIGYNPEEGKWYGWSHRALYGFSVGSTCVKGDCHYRPVDKEDFLEDCVRFWEDTFRDNTWAEHTSEGVVVSWIYNETVPNERLRGKQGGVTSQYPDVYGKGEWTSKSIADALQMAIDFANGVS